MATPVLESAELVFVAADGAARCTLSIYLQGNWRPQADGLAPLLDVPAAQALADGEGQVQLLEGVRYEYALDNAAYRLALAQHYTDTQGIVMQSKAKGRAHCGVLNPGLATGRLPLVLLDQTGAIQSSAFVEVRSRKLSYKADYQHMMQDITAYSVDLLQELRAPSLFKAEPDPGHDAVTLGQRFAFVRALLQNPAFENALHRITTHPHQVWQHEAHERSIARGFKPTGKVLRQLAQGSRRVAVPVSHPLHATLETLPEFVTVNRATPTHDTPENRFVKFALRSFHQFLDTLRARVPDPTKDARLVQEITALCTRLDEALASGVMRQVSEPTFLPLGSPTLQRREGYREVLQAWLQFAMAAKLVWHGGEQVFGAGQRDVATLYEYWVFFKLLDVVAKVFTLSKPSHEALLEPTSDGFGLKLRAGKFVALQGVSTQPGRVLNVQFSYNRSFVATQRPRQAGSWSENLRPDYTLSLWPVEFTADQAELQELMVHVHFDAKYRIDQVAALLREGEHDQEALSQAGEDALSEIKREENRGSYKRADLLKMHAYRDAIRRTQGAYVVYPGVPGDDKRLNAFHEVLPGLGAFALRPGAGTQAIETFMRDVVNHVSDRASAREQHSFHTWQTYESAPPPTAQEQRASYLVLPEKGPTGDSRAKPLRETFVVVGWVKGDAHLQWVESTGKYNFRMGSAVGGLRLSVQVVGATYLLLHGANGVAVPGLFRIEKPEIGPAVHSAAELTAMGYPSAPTQLSYLVYDVVRATEFDSTEWNMAALANKPSNAAQGHPFALSLLDLMLVSRNTGS
ncbi:DUF2357 domain-containing protein [Rhodoferax aquaticus]|uniref:DUF2357 domain-containing protein n=1 Tax=Rhodoferax aquaticus TaxID=2527691 RepID=A0A515EMN8_9BURK|nr:DUF2357 domain-containing protein [Rhodoferax aquaticus]QDL53921.1 DUF2357 domain-containing protein [Rhodoferax aquaticus]